MPTDRSHTELVRRRRAVAQAVRRAVCETCLELGPIGPVDGETVLSRRFGQAAYFSQQGDGTVVEQSCCSSTPTPTPGTCVYVPACSGPTNRIFNGSGSGGPYTDTTICRNFTASGVSGRLTLIFASGIVVDCINLNDGNTYPSTNGITGLSSVDFEVNSICFPPGPGANVILASSGSGTFDASQSQVLYVQNNITSQNRIWMTLCYDGDTITVQLGTLTSVIEVTVGGTGLGSYVFSTTP